MRGYNETITIWNAFKNTTKGVFEYYRHTVNGCLWDNEQKVQTSGTTLISANNYRVGIEELFNTNINSTLYKDYAVWQSLIQDEKKVYWTVNKGDLVARGVWDIEITGISPSTVPNTKTMTQPYSFTINSIEDHTQDYKRGKHITIIGV